MMYVANRRRFLRIALGCGGGMGLGVWSLRDPTGPSALKPVSRMSRALGTQVTFTVLHGSEEVAGRAIDAAFADLELIESVMSLYRTSSQLRRLNREGVLDDPHPYLVTVLSRAAEISGRTGGAFDVTVQPLWELYASRSREGGLPDLAALEQTRRRVDWRRVEINPRRIRLRGEGTAVTLNGIAQGFAADRAAAVLRSHGIEHALVDAGEIRPLGRKSDDTAWTVGIQHPRITEAYASVARLDGRALSTSGDYATSFDPDHRHHHIVDPHTGSSPATFSSVSVVAPTCMDADALSTALFVLDLEPAAALIGTMPRADALFILKDGRTMSTADFPGEA